MIFTKSVYIVRLKKPHANSSVGGYYFNSIIIGNGWKKITVLQNERNEKYAFISYSVRTLLQFVLLHSALEIHEFFPHQMTRIYYSLLFILHYVCGYGSVVLPTIRFNNFTRTFYYIIICSNTLTVYTRL